MTRIFKKMERRSFLGLVYAKLDSEKELSRSSFIELYRNARLTPLMAFETLFADRRLDGQKIGFKGPDVFPLILVPDVPPVPGTAKTPGLMSLFSRSEPYLENRLGYIYRMWGRPLEIKFILMQDSYRMVECKPILEQDALSLISSAINPESLAEAKGKGRKV